MLFTTLYNLESKVGSSELKKNLYLIGSYNKIVGIKNNEVALLIVTGSMNTLRI